ncbi:MAG: helix-turn-helix domain-containing protein [Bacteroidota bacterium]
MQACLFLIGFSRNSKPWRFSDRMLMIILACIAVILAHHGLFIAWPEDDPRRYWFIGLSASAWLAVPSAFYLYILGLTQVGFQMRWRHLWLFLVPIYHSISWLWSMAGLKLGFYQLFAGNYELYNFLWITSYLVLTLGFAWMSFRAARPLRGTSLNWLSLGSLLFLIASGMAAMIFAILIYLDRYSEIFEFSLLLLFAVFVLVLAYKSIGHAQRAPWLGHRPYQTIGLPKDRLELLAGKLHEYMIGSQAYLDADLSLAHLCTALSCSQQELSQVFSRQLETNFYDYLSSFRMEAFEKAVRAGEAEKLTVVALAKQCGFKSKTAFYRIFREHHGTTPAAYLKEMA